MSNSPYTNTTLREIAYAISDYEHRVRTADASQPDAKVADQADRVARLLDKAARQFRNSADAWRPRATSAAPDAGSGS